MSKQNEQKQDRKEFTPEEKLAYFHAKKVYWTAKKERLLHPPKIKHAERRVKHYEQQIEQFS